MGEENQEKMRQTIVAMIKQAVHPIAPKDGADGNGKGSVFYETQRDTIRLQ
eukprot:gnl/Chilomastix_caulleri/2412.p1 GENE.gnl/Chilomastix_caulleri/2412~~gnl/Chilomastix_caulleri/2412.p1  ORF type:complete len:51 (-),score=6.77 gnl/Chilomastix_caulleri/2412:38-190(-)